MEGFESFIGVNFWTAIFTLCNTLAIFFVLKKYLFVPVKKMIDDRQQEIDDMYSQAEQSRQSAKALQADYQVKLSEAQKTCDTMVRDATVRAQSREEEIIRQANAEASAIRSKAVADIAMEKKKAMNDAKDEISDTAVAIAEKVVGRQLSADDHSQLIAEFIDRLGDEA